MYTLGGDNVAYIDQAAASATGSFTFAIRDSLKNETSFKVLVGGTDVAEAGEATITLGSATPTTPVFTFTDDEGAVSDVDYETVEGGIKIKSLPENAKPNTRYYWGWYIAGDEDTVYALGDVIPVTADTEFVAKYYPKGDMSQDGSVDSTDADIAFAMELGDNDYINDSGFNKFWTLDEDESGAIAGDMSGDGSVDSTDADLAFAMELGDTDYIIDSGFDIFWEE